MKKALQLVLLFLPLAAILTISSCGPQDPPKPPADLITVNLQNGYTGPCVDMSLNVNITVEMYDDLGVFEGVFSTYTTTVDSGVISFPNIEIPRAKTFRIEITLSSRFCTQCCIGSCVVPPATGGLPVFQDDAYIVYNGFSTPDTISLSPSIIECN